MDFSAIMSTLDEQLKPYRQTLPATTRLPAVGWSRGEILRALALIEACEVPRWREGYASGAVYHGEEDHIDFLNRVYAMYSQANPLHADLWPSLVKFEAEIVAMTAHMLGAGAVPPDAGPEERICGTVTSGGTESILLAMRAYRDWARQRKGIAQPAIVAPVTAHAAYDKAAQYFGMKIVRLPVDREFRADVGAIRTAVSDDTAVIVASAPGFPHGTIDPVADMAAIAAERGIGCHVDACLGGFVLPWAERLGYPVPPFDFRVPGVTSVSVDTHKYGYAPKGTSVILYRGKHLRHYQYFMVADWPGGIYVSPTMAGSRPGALSAACWAALMSMGEEGYMEATRRILETASAIKEGIRAIPGLRILGEPLWVTAFTSDEVDIFRVMAAMGRRGWSLNPLNHPPALHLAVTLRHTLPGVAERFLADLRAAVEEARANAGAPGGVAAIYGLTATLPAEMVQEALKAYLDYLYEV
jgi:glutamate/tyrosine decarboxylase-like PLP-dependent enzyme